jgi:hypothetical protein
MSDSLPLCWLPSLDTFLMDAGLAGLTVICASCSYWTWKTWLICQWCPHLCNVTTISLLFFSLFDFTWCYFYHYIFVHWCFNIFLYNKFLLSGIIHALQSFPAHHKYVHHNNPLWYHATHSIAYKYHRKDLLFSSDVMVEAISWLKWRSFLCAFALCSNLCLL